VVIFTVFESCKQTTTTFAQNTANMVKQDHNSFIIDHSKSLKVDKDRGSPAIAENSTSLHGSNNGDHQSKSSSYGNDMNEVCELATTAAHTLRKWKIVVFVILFCTFSCIITAAYLMLSNEHKDDDEEAVSENYRINNCHCCNKMEHELLQIF
jgi:hypothetical protein